MMAKPIRALELHYPMIQFLIVKGKGDIRLKVTKNEIPQNVQYKM